MAESVDYYDVQSMIRDERSAIRGEITNAVDELRREVRAVADELREAIAATDRTLESRTAHLV